MFACAQAIRRRLLHQRTHATVVYYTTNNVPSSTRAQDGDATPSKRKPAPRQWHPDSLVIRREDVERADGTNNSMSLLLILLLFSVRTRVNYTTALHNRKPQGGKWDPKRTLPYHVMQQIRMLHKEVYTISLYIKIKKICIHTYKQDPTTYSVHLLMEKYHAPFQAIVRILKSKFEPSPEKIAKKIEKSQKLREQRKLERDQLEMEAEKVRTRVWGRGGSTRANSVGYAGKQCKIRTNLKFTSCENNAFVVELFDFYKACIAFPIPGPILFAPKHRVWRLSRSCCERFFLVIWH
jgi:hypothetical protein